MWDRFVLALKTTRQNVSALLGLNSVTSAVRVVRTAQRAPLSPSCRGSGLCSERQAGPVAISGGTAPLSMCKLRILKIHNII